MAFTSRSTFVGGRQLGVIFTSGSGRLQSSGLTMRDHSASYWFQVGDAVKVVEDVIKAGSNLRERQGVVVQTWEKCDVDPTCCCAEQVDLGMAVRVEFQGSEQAIDGEGRSFFHYFAEEELIKQADAKEETKAVIQDVSEDSQIAFDGMSCMAFKLDQLQLDKKPRKLASFEPSRLDSDPAKQ
jgi:hypothetical protein